MRLICKNLCATSKVLRLLARRLAAKNCGRTWHGITVVALQHRAFFLLWSVYRVFISRLHRGTNYERFAQARTGHWSLNDSKGLKISRLLQPVCSLSSSHIRPSTWRSQIPRLQHFLHASPRPLLKYIKRPAAHTNFVDFAPLHEPLTTNEFVCLPFNADIVQIVCH